MAKISFTGCVQEEKKYMGICSREYNNIYEYMHTYYKWKKIFIQYYIDNKVWRKKCTEREWRAKKDPKYKIKKLHSED